jgi:Flp pilus assembly protein TadG
VTRTKFVGPRSRRGATLVMVAMLLSVLIGVAAIALDMSRLYLYKSQLQTSADVGALTAALRVNAGDRVFADDSAVLYAQRNAVETVVPVITTGNVEPGSWNFGTRVFTPSGGDWTLSTVNAVRATTSHTAGYTFAKIFGGTTRSVSARAVAAIGYVGATDCVRPWAVHYAPLLQQIGQSATNINYNLTDADVVALRNATIANQITLKVGDASNTITGGWFYAVREGPIQYADGTMGDPWSGANDYRDAISGCALDKNGKPITIGPGDWLQAEKGNMVGPTDQGVKQMCGVSNGTKPPYTCNQTIKAVIWGSGPGTQFAGPVAFQVKYVAAFVVTGQPADGEVTGYFKAIETTGSLSATPTPLTGKVLLVQ